ncbi:MAG: M48 family metallopeptidase [Bacteroidota bacterium]|nr:MAG: M48 family metallopeptidase [Bacteroidota bacterium]
MNLKTLRQFVILFGAFFLIWFALSRIEFIKPETTEKLSKQKEETLGKLFIDQVLSQNDTCRTDSVVYTIRNLMKHLCRSNNIDTQSIQLHLIHHSEINAYALPGRHIVLHSALVQYCNNPEELTAVLAHEVAHIEKNHVMKKLTREVGIALLTAVISGGNNGEIVGEMVHTLSSNHYSRELESEADATAIKYLVQAGVNPLGLSDFLFRLSKDQDQLISIPWISTHPESNKRVAEILELSQTEQYTEQAIIDSVAWASIKNMLATETEY